MSSAPFDLDAFLALPRLEDLTLSPDGRRLVTAVKLPDAGGKAFVSSLWELDPHGRRPPRRLTGSAEGESSPTFAPDGSLLFASARPRPGGAGGPPDPVTGLWRLPPSGEAVSVAAPPGGVQRLAVARSHGRVVLATAVHPGCSTWEEDATREQGRSERHVTAQLYTSYPVRHWDRWFGPRGQQLFAQAGDGGAGAFTALTPDAAYDLEETAHDVAPDGSAVVTSWRRPAPGVLDSGEALVLVPIGTGGGPGERRVLVEEPRVSYSCVAYSPDGRSVAAVRAFRGTPDACAAATVVVVEVATGRCRDLLEGSQRWPHEVCWAPSSDTVYFTADDDGHLLPFAADVATGTVRRLAPEGSFASLVAAPDGRTLYALRSSVGEPPHAVAVSTGEAHEPPRRIPCPAPAAGEPGGVPAYRVERVETQAADGARVPGWLVLPDPGTHEGGAPLVVFVHGGPLASWNTWHWRWCPQLLAARGWAVLLGDPALSLGYGQDFVERGWGRWGAEPYTDTMALTEEVCRRPDVDGGRAAVMGGSFGGYLANWIVGHNDRFRAAVTHASLWDLEAFHGSTDIAAWVEAQFGDPYREPERLRQWSPHAFVDRITTPMLVIHSERDYRVPVSEALALWTDLARHGVEAAYLHFPDENHWILSPPHVRVWYSTVFAFLDHHVLGRPWQRPEHV